MSDKAFLDYAGLTIYHKKLEPILNSSNETPKIGDIKITAQPSISEDFALCNHDYFSREKYSELSRLLDPDELAWLNGGTLFSQGSNSNPTSGYPYNDETKFDYGNGIFLVAQNASSNIDSNYFVPRVEYTTDGVNYRFYNIERSGNISGRAISPVAVKYVSNKNKWVILATVDGATYNDTNKLVCYSSEDPTDETSWKESTVTTITGKGHGGYFLDNGIACAGVDYYTEDYLTWKPMQFYTVGQRIKVVNIKDSYFLLTLVTYSSGPKKWTIYKVPSLYNNNSGETIASGIPISDFAEPSDYWYAFSTVIDDTAYITARQYNNSAHYSIMVIQYDGKVFTCKPGLYAPSDYSGSGQYRSILKIKDKIELWEMYSKTDSALNGYANYLVRQEIIVTNTTAYCSHIKSGRIFGYTNSDKTKTVQIKKYIYKRT